MLLYSHCCASSSGTYPCGVKALSDFLGVGSALVNLIRQVVIYKKISLSILVCKLHLNVNDDDTSPKLPTHQHQMTLQQLS